MEGWGSWRGRLGWVLVVEAAVIGATTLYLLVASDPSAASAWADVYATRAEVRRALWARSVRLWAVALAVPTLVAWVVARRQGDEAVTPSG